MSKGKLITLSIDVTKVPKERIFKGQKGSYMDLDVWINEDADQYGNHASANLRQSKEEREAGDKKIYVGNGKKMFGWDDQPAPAPATAATPASSTESQDDIPF